MSDENKNDKPKPNGENEQNRRASIEAPPYQVGFKRPPIETRFKTGQSGNRKGRPKGTPNFMTLFEKELAVTVDVNEHGRRQKMTKAQVGLRQLLNKAASGDAKAIGAVIGLLGKSGKLNTTPTPTAPSVELRDLQAIEGVLKFFETSSRETDDPANGKAATKNDESGTADGEK